MYNKKDKRKKGHALMFFIDSQTPYHSCDANLHLKYISVAELNTGYSDGAKFYPTSLAVHKH